METHQNSWFCANINGMPLNNDLYAPRWCVCRTVENILNLNIITLKYRICIHIRSFSFLAPMLSKSSFHFLRFLALNWLAFSSPFFLRFILNYVYFFFFFPAGVVAAIVVVVCWFINVISCNVWGLWSECSTQDTGHKHTSSFSFLPGCLTPLFIRRRWRTQTNI